MLKNLQEWRQKIEAFLKANSDLIQKDRVVDIGVGGSSDITRSINPNIIIMDKNRQGFHNDKIYKDQIIYKDLTKKEDLIDLEKFDTVICCEVLEHTDNPFQAVENLIYITKPGGSILVTVPCYLPWHPSDGVYPDYWRFMPSSLKHLFQPHLTKEFRYESDTNQMPIGISCVVKV